VTRRAAGSRPAKSREALTLPHFGKVPPKCLSPPYGHELSGYVGRFGVLVSVNYDQPHVKYYLTGCSDVNGPFGPQYSCIAVTHSRAVMMACHRISPALGILCPTALIMALGW
jgi:hypothetical protein